MKGIRLAELTWPEAKEAMARCPIAMLPIGAGSKQHGPHLPCGTDMMFIEAVAERVVAEVPVLLLPTLSYGYYPHFTDWPGTISVAIQHFTGMVGDIIRSLARYGIAKFLILDGGVSTYPPLLTLSRDLHVELGILVAVTNIRGLGEEVASEVAEQESGGHADEIETSCMLAVRPDLVKMDRAVKGFLAAVPGTQDACGVTKVGIVQKLTEPHGVNGDATLATVEKGEKVLAASVRDVVTFLEHFSDFPKPAGS
jgi:creatinine amidohydrolase